MKKLKRGHIVQIIIAVVGVMGGIIIVLIQTCKVQTIELYLTNIETKQGITGEVFIDADTDGKPSYPEKPAVLKIKRGNRFIRAESKGYEPKIVPVENVVISRTIEMKEIAGTTVVKPISLSLVGWIPWGGLRIDRGAQDNEIIVNGELADAGGFFNTSLPAVLRNKTLVLRFSNVNESNFSRNRMAKLVYNRDDILLRPVNESLQNGEYIPNRDTPPDSDIEFPIPDDFDGKLGFVFYQAELNDLKITATYK